MVVLRSRKVQPNTCTPQPHCKRVRREPVSAPEPYHLSSQSGHSFRTDADPPTRFDRKGDTSISRGTRRYSRNEKGKEKVADEDHDVSSSSNLHIAEAELKLQVNGLVDSLEEKCAVLENEISNVRRATREEQKKHQYHNIAKENASRFAHFDSRGQVDAHPLTDVDEETPAVEEEQVVGDWPGPFSTALKIIRDRESQHSLKMKHGTSPSEAKTHVPITWVPRNSQCSIQSKRMVPHSLQELSMRTLVNNVGALVSLDYVPDNCRHRICQLLCDSRQMNTQFLELLVRGSPVEIQVSDCSWLTEEEFTKCFSGCDTSNLEVLRLDNCGRCISDYSLQDTLVRSSGSLCALSTLGLSGACRLSDAGLKSLVVSASGLRSINLSQCSLLTSKSISTLSDSLGPFLQELTIDDCQSIDAQLILSALQNLEQLEALSLAGMSSVSDGFIKKLAISHGHNLKKLVLSNCTKLTDISMKAIGQHCCGLCVLDIVKLYNLTDATLRHLANSCQKLHNLKMGGNSFSDEAVAAFLQTSGKLLKHLSLNNVKKVGSSTALSIARHCTHLVSLDLSWCRNLGDDAVGLMVDNCFSLKMIKLFGCGQITDVFLDGHSNPQVQVVGLKLSPVLEHVTMYNSQQVY